MEIFNIVITTIGTLLMALTTGLLFFNIKRLTLDRKQRTVEFIKDSRDTNRKFYHYVVNYRDKEGKRSGVFMVYEEGLSKEQRKKEN